MLDAMAGYDPNDPVTALGVGHIPKSYTAFLKNGLKGARLGVFKNLFGNGPDYEQVNKVMAKTIEALKAQGAVIVPVEDPAIDPDNFNANVRLNEFEFQTDINHYLETQGSRVPVHSLAEIIASGKYDKGTLTNFFANVRSHPDGFNDPAYKDRRIKMQAIKIEVANLMAQNHVDALVFPHQRGLVVPIGETNQPGINGVVAALAGFPSIVVPAGFSMPTVNAPLGVPVGMEIVGRSWHEPQLLMLAYGLEQATHARKPPQSVPNIKKKPN
jgi:Asp-tRNA(Asn)/Glu-tRNA(Gln) amidotransferase A subunit family amidase